MSTSTKISISGQISMGKQEKRKLEKTGFLLLAFVVTKISSF